MRTRLLPILVLILSVVTLKLSASPMDKICYANSEFIYDNKIISSNVTCILQDSDNYIWMGTHDGLIRYDGYTFKTFKSDFRSPEIFKNNGITALANDSRNNIWIGTIGGLYIYDQEQKEIKEMKISQMNEKKVLKIFVESDSSIWISYVDVLLCFNPITGESSKFFYPGNNNPSESAVDRDKNIWFAFSSLGLYKFDISTKKFTQYYVLNKKNSAIIAIFNDDCGNIWFSIWNQGLFKMVIDKATGKSVVTRYEHDQYGRSLKSNIIYEISQNPKNGDLWILTKKGITIMSQENGITFTDFDLSNITPNNNAYFGNILFDNNGILWLSSKTKGIARISFLNDDIQEFFLRDSLNPVKLTHIHQFKDGEMWLAIENQGLYRYDMDKFQRYLLKGAKYKAFNSLQNLSQINEINDSLTIINNQYTYSFLVKKQKDNINIKSRRFPEGLRKLKYYIDDLGNIIQTSDKKLVLKNAKGEVLYENDSMPMVSCYYSKGNEHWIGSEGNGLIRLITDGNDVVVKKYNKKDGTINTNHILSILIDNLDRIWVGTKGGGLSLYNPEKDCFTLKNYDYNIYSGDIFNLCQYGEDDIWFTTKNSISRISFSEDAKPKVQVVYSTRGNINDISFVPEVFQKTSDNKLLVGGHNGFVLIKSPDLKVREKTNDIHITDVKVKNESIINSGKENLFREKGMDCICLEHDENDLRLEFSSMDMTDAHSVRYVYKLEGVDNDWRVSNIGENFAIYNNLSKGQYLFQVRILNQSLPSSKQLHIRVKPDRFHTTFAYFLYTILGLTLAFFIIYLLVKISRSKMNEMHILDQKKKSEELNEMKLKFFTNVSHELLTPLSIISCGIEDLTEGQEDKSQEVRIIQENINRLTKLIRQVLEFKKVESGRSILKVSYGDIASFVENICQVNFKPLIHEKKINFSFLSTKKEILGFFDKDKIDKIIYNLLSNAFKYNREYCIINVVVEECDFNGGRGVQIIVKDNGNGISKEKQKYIFDRYVDGDYRKFNTTGTGIGLSLTKDLTELHHGEIHLISDIGQGCEFIIRIPLEQQFYNEKEIDPEALESMQNSIQAGQDCIAFDKTLKTILIVEDSDDLRVIMYNILQGKYNIVCAKNGKDGLNQLRTHEIDLIITDIMMPEMDGFEMCSIIRNDLTVSHIPIIMLTAKSSEEDKLKGYEIGIDDFMSKPVNIKMLGIRIENLLDKVQEKISIFKEKNKICYNSIDEKFIEKAISTAEKHIHETDFNFEDYIGEMNVSKSTLYRKLKVLTGMTPSDFIRSIKLKRAYRIMQEKKVSISEVAYDVGFNDPKYFSSCFKKEFGMTPTEFINQNHK